MIVSLLLTFVVSFLLNFGFIYAFKSRDFEDTFEGPQKFHIIPVQRIGGVAVAVSVLTGTLFYYLLINQFDQLEPLFIILSSIPITIAGWAEDISKKISPYFRLSAALVSVIIGSFLLDIVIVNVDVSLFDKLLQFKFFAYIFTIIAVAGVANSINIIDGYNGLSSVVAILIFFSLGYVAFEVNDSLILALSLITIGAISGFFIWNYPFGRIFLGDGGAYFIGYLIAILSILLVNRNPEVSPWFPLLIVIYPVFETVFSMYRRKFLKKSGLEKADSYHLHQLIYKRVIPFVFKISRNDKLFRNSATSPFLWLICSCSIIPAVIFWKLTPVLILFVILFCIFYIILYRSIVKFRIGKYLK